MTKPIAPDTLIERLERQAQSVSDVHKQMADAKTARQVDRDDYPELASVGYDWIKPEQTLEWEAKRTLEANNRQLQRCREALENIRNKSFDPDAISEARKALASIEGVGE